MDSARISALLEPYLERSLSPSQLEKISIYIDLLLRWNARINLTAIRSEEEIVTRHFGESLFLARHLFPTNASGSEPIPTPEGAPSKLRLGGDVRADVRAIDIGSGAGFPAIPLKIWAPEIHLTLIESNHKKAAFLNEVARALALTEIDVVNDRTEALTTRLSSQADVVTLRAVERFETILPQAAAFLSPKGRLALLITTAQTSSLAILPTVTWRQHIRLPRSSTALLSIGCKL
jgi:16S rRNA (guanine527-N7)-methyltransferase